MEAPEAQISLAIAAKISGYSMAHLRRLCVAGKLGAVKVGNSWLVNETLVRNFGRSQLTVPVDMAEIVHTTPQGYNRLQKLAFVTITLLVIIPTMANLSHFFDVYHHLVSQGQSEANRIVRNYLQTQGFGLSKPNNDQTPERIVERIINNPEGAVLGTTTSAPTDEQVLNSLRNILQTGLPADLQLVLQGPPGEAGPAGPMGPAGINGITTTISSAYIPNSGSVFGITAPTAQPGSAGTIGSATYLSSKEFFTDQITVSGTSELSSLNISGNSTLSGDLTVNGTTTLNGLVITNSLLTSNAQSTFTKVPTLAHSFVPSWPSGTSNAADGTVYINPASSIADGNLLSAAVGGSIKFLVDSEGDIYGNNLILTGSTTTGATTISGNLTVQDNTVLGDAGTDTVTFNAQAITDLTFKKADPNLIFDVTTATDTDFWAGVIDDGAGDDDDVFQIGKGTTPGTTPFLTVSTLGRLGIGTDSPTSLLHVRSTSAFPTINIESTQSGGGLLQLTSATNNWQMYNGGGKLQWDGSTTAGVELTMDSSGNVGIGTTNPQAKLDVVGFIRSGEIGAGYSGLELVDQANAIQWQLLKNVDDSFAIWENGVTDRFHISEGGNVGIGTTNPGGKLDVVQTDNSQNVFRVANASGNAVQKFVITDGTKTNWLIGAQNNVDNGFEISPSTAVGGNSFGDPPALVIKNTGNVGIGTTNPQAKLHLLTSTSATGAISTALRLDHTDSGTPASGFGQAIDFYTKMTDGSNQQAGKLYFKKFDGNNNYQQDFGLQVMGNSLADVLRIRNANSTVNAVVGLGASFTAVNGGYFPTLTAADASSNLFAVWNNSTAANNATARMDFVLNTNSGSHNVPYASITGISTNVADAGAQGALAFSTFNAAYGGATSERMRIDKDGNVGIGTTNPSMKFEINGLGGGTQYLKYGGDGTGYVGTSGGVLEMSDYFATNPYGIFVDNGGSLRLENKTADKGLTIDSGGNTSMSGTTAITSTTSPQLTVAYDVTNKISIGVASNGFTTITAAGSAPGINFTGANTVNVGGTLSNGNYPFAVRRTTNQILAVGQQGGELSLEAVNDAVNANVNLRIYTSQLALMGGNVGIGTTNPTALLNLHGASGSNPSYVLTDGDVDHGVTGSRFSTSAIFDIKSYSSTDGGAWVGGYSDAAGTPGMTLQGIIGVTDSTDSIPALLLNGSKKNTTSEQAMGASETVLQVETGLAGSGTKLLTILGSGNVGIGTTNPAQKLDLRLGNGIEGVAMQIGNTSSGVFGTLGFEGLNGAPFQVFGTTGAALALGSNGSEKVRITTGGNVGIGTTNPASNLEVRGALPSLLISDTGSGASNLDFRAWGSTVTSSRIQGNEASAANSGTLNLMTKTNSGSLTTAVFIDEDGFVGIGNNTDPATRLDVNGEAYIRGRLGLGGGALTFGSSGNDAPDMGYNAKHTSTAGVWNYLAADTVSLIHMASGGFKFKGTSTIGVAGNPISFTDYMTILSSGNVGIGTTNPSGLLQVYGTGSNAIFSLDTSNGAVVESRLLADAVNTTRDTGGLILRGRYWDGAASQNFDAQLDVDVTGNNAGAVHLRTGGTSRLTVLHSSGNVGIGTTGPNVNLEVRKDTAGVLTALRVNNNDNTNGTSNARVEAIVGGTSGGDASFMLGISGSLNWTVGLDNSDSDKFKIGYNQVVGTDTALTIDTSGNVGIGTTTPSSTLSVNGTVTLVGLPTTTTNESMPVLFKNSSNALEQDSTLNWNPNQNMLTVDGTLIGPGYITTAVGINLSLGTNNSGANLITLHNSSTNVGIAETNPSTAKLVIAQTDAANLPGLYINSEESSDAQSVFSIETDSTVGSGADTLHFKITADGSVYSDANVYSTPADVAEMYYVQGNAQPGDVVEVVPAANEDTFAVTKSTGTQTIMGVISTAPGPVMNYDWKNPGKLAMQKPVALVGRVPVKVSEENGAIHTGDRLTSSTQIPGYAAKMIESGQSIGIALEDSSGGTEGTDMILVFVNLGYQKIQVAQNAEGELVSTESDLDMAGFAIINIKSLASASGKWSIDENGNFVAQKVRANHLELIDEDSGEVYCVKVKSGELMHLAGACADQPAVSGESTPPPADEPVDPPTEEQPAEEPPPAEEPVPDPAPPPAEEPPAETPAP